VLITNQNTERIMLTLIDMNPKWVSELVDIEGAFLESELVDDKDQYVEVPDGFNKYRDAKMKYCS